MGWTKVIVLSFCLILSETFSSAQIIGRNILGNCPCQNTPVNFQPSSLPLNAPNNVLRLSNSNCGCNNVAVTSTLANLPINRMASPAERLAIALSQPAANLNTPIGAQIARNLPVQQSIPQLYQNQNAFLSDVKIIGRIPLNNQNIPTNYVLQQAPVKRFINQPAPELRIVPQSNVVVNNPTNIRLNRIATVPVNELKNLLQNALPTNVVRLSINDLLNVGNNVAINNVNNNLVKAVPNAGYQQMVLPNGKIITTVPIVPLNSLANLPIYNGLPVLKVSESTYKLTPI